MSIEAMKQALEALEDISSLQNHSDSGESSDVNKAITSLRQAIAEESSATQEPVAEKVYDPEDDTAYIQYFIPHELIPVGTKLYTHPQPKADHIPDAKKMVEQEPKREPLTDEQINELFLSTAGQNNFGVPYLRLYFGQFKDKVRAIEAAHCITKGQA